VQYFANYLIVSSHCFAPGASQLLGECLLVSKNVRVLNSEERDIKASTIFILLFIDSLLGMRPMNASVDFYA
jgi:hypothetical protein